MQRTKEITKEVEALAHKILRERMNRAGVKTVPTGWASEAVTQAQKEIK